MLLSMSISHVFWLFGKHRFPIFRQKETPVRDSKPMAGNDSRLHESKHSGRINSEICTDEIWFNKGLDGDSIKSAPPSLPAAMTFQVLTASMYDFLAKSKFADRKLQGCQFLRI